MTPKKALLIFGGCLLVFQWFIRYDHWRLDDGRRAEYDMLTGRTTILENGQRRNLVQWLTGGSPRHRKLKGKHAEDNTEDEEVSEDAAQDEDTRSIVSSSSSTSDRNADNGVALFQQAEAQEGESSTSRRQSRGGRNTQASEADMTGTRWEGGSDSTRESTGGKIASTATQSSRQSTRPRADVLEADLGTSTTQRSRNTQATNQPNTVASGRAQTASQPSVACKKRAAQQDAAPTPDEGGDQLAMAPALHAPNSFVAPPPPRSVGSMSLRPARHVTPVVSGNDLNQDGSAEQIIQSAPSRLGIIDFAVVSQGKELFYGKGHQLRILTTRHKGWPDIAVVQPGDRVQVFRFDDQSGGYEAAGQ
jgi:hypothetical protein